MDEIIPNRRQHHQIARQCLPTTIIITIQQRIVSFGEEKIPLKQKVSHSVISTSIQFRRITRSSFILGTMYLHNVSSSFLAVTTPWCNEDRFSVHYYQRNIYCLYGACVCGRIENAWLERQLTTAFSTPIKRALKFSSSSNAFTLLLCCFVCGPVYIGISIRRPFPFIWWFSLFLPLITCTLRSQRSALWKRICKIHSCAAQWKRNVEELNCFMNMK